MSISKGCCSHKLPDELVHEIISSVLSVSYEVFADTRNRSPFSHYKPSDSYILLVCKRWLRIATPLLYEFAVIRSTAQAEALARTLNANKHLGTYIKKLRVEGGYGATMRKIILAAPNIMDLFLYLPILSGDSASGLCSSLGSINPERVILHDPQTESVNNSQVRLLVAKLCKCIKEWSNMKVFDFPYSSARFAIPQLISERITCITNALSEAPSLETLYIPHSHYWPQALHPFARNSSLKAIKIKASPAYIDQNPYRADIMKDSKLRPLMTFPEKLSKALVPTILPFEKRFTTPPMINECASVKEHIWNQILISAMQIRPWGEELSLTWFRWFRATRGNQTRRNLALVSKTFHRLAIPHLYGSPVLIGVSQLRSFSERLALDSALGAYIRSLFFWDEGSPDVAEDLRYVLSVAPRLVQFRGVTLLDFSLVTKIGWNELGTLANKAGSTLVAFRDIQVMPEQVLRSPALLHHFTQLRSLDWLSLTQFEVDRQQISPDCLSNLEFINFRRYDPSFLDILSRMDLPALSRVAFPVTVVGAMPFFVKHGTKIRELLLSGFSDVPLFDLCPTLSLLNFHHLSPVPNPRGFHCSTAHKSLVKVVIPKKLNYDNRDDWSNFFQDVNLGSFTALREIQAPSCVWPTTEREISKGPWPGWAESLLKWDVKLTDDDGRGWRPRLKTARGR